MSVYKSRRKDASAQFIADARELRRMTARAVKRFPSSYRYIVTNGLLEMAREIVVNSVWMTETASSRTRPNTRRSSTASRPRATPS